MSETSKQAGRMSPVVDPAAKAAFTKLLLRDFHALDALLRERRLEKDVVRIGYELELNFLDQNCEPACVGCDITKALDDPRFTTEFARFNLEINSCPALLNGNCFGAMEAELETALAAVKLEAAKHNCSVLLTGIVPTLKTSHISPEALTPEPRYQALHEIRRTLKGKHYEYRIQGIDELFTRDNIALFAGSVTSFQVHLQLDPDDLVDPYNWAQLLAGPLLANSANSPLFLGKRLWQETRIELFERATDTRVPDSDGTRNLPRVFFGNKWVEESVLELLQEDIIGFDPVFTSSEVEDPAEALAAQRSPRLDAWTLFNGSIYRWNRLCYGRLDGKASLRIENRMLPAGPTVVDMVANAAFWTGAMAGLPQRYRQVQKRLDFALVKENFFKAARFGLDVKFGWFDGPVSARELILDELLPLAHAGLQKLGIDDEEGERLLGVIRERTETGRTGAHWMLSSFAALQKNASPDQALHSLTAGMLARQHSGLPVHRWEPVDALEDGNGARRICPVHKVMTSALYKVKVNDAVDLTTHLMHWKKIGHVPVEDDNGDFVGMITRNTLIDFLSSSGEPYQGLKAAELMTSAAVVIGPDTPLRHAIALMLKHATTFLPVVINKRIIGLITEHDIVKVADVLMAGCQQSDQSAGPGASPGSVPDQA